MIVYLAILIASATGIIASLILVEGAPGSPWTILALAILGALAERSSVRLSTTAEISISILPTLFAAVAIGPLAAVLVSAASMLGDLRSPYMKWAIYTSTRAINGAVMGVVAASVEGEMSARAGSIALATGLAALIGQGVDVVLAAVTVQVRRGCGGRTLLQTVLPVLPSSALLYTAVVAPLAIAYEEWSPWAALLFFIPALAAQRLFVMYQQQRQLATELATANQSLERANLSFASALVATLDARDRYTAGHSAAVAVYARDTAARMHLSPEMQQLAHLSGLLHDIGKVGVPPGVLEKNGPLTAIERLKMEQHTVIGQRILDNVEAYSEIAVIVRHHHERVDGRGYPDGLVADEIPIVSRLICVADAYNAMTSDRPYRDALSADAARAILRDGAGTQFDARVVSAFDSLLENAPEIYVRGARADFAVEAQAHPEFAPGAMTAA